MSFFCYSKEVQSFLFYSREVQLDYGTHYRWVEMSFFCYSKEVQSFLFYSREVRLDYGTHYRWVGGLECHFLLFQGSSHFCFIPGKYGWTMVHIIGGWVGWNVIFCYSKEVVIFVLFQGSTAGLWHINYLANVLVISVVVIVLNRHTR